MYFGKIYQLSRTCQADHRLYPAGIDHIAALSLKTVRWVGQPEHQGQMATGAMPHRPDSVRDNSVFFRVCPKPADRAFHVVDLGGKGVFHLTVFEHIGTSIINRDRDIPTFSCCPHLIPECRFVGGLPSAACDENQRREWA